MKKIKNILYVLGAILLILKIFFKENFSEELNNGLWLSTGIFLLLIIIFEVLTKRR
jgi:hypothetical protein